MAVRFKASLTEHNNAFTLGVCSSGVAKSANIRKTVRPSGPWDRTGPRSLSLSCDRAVHLHIHLHLQVGLQLMYSGDLILMVSVIEKMTL